MITNKDTFLQLLDTNKGIIFRICYSYCSTKDDADDLAQEIIFNLWKAYPNYTPDYKFTTWMYRIALNVAISYYRKDIRALRFTTIPEDLILFDDNEMELYAETNNKLELLHRFIHELNEIDKSIILLYLDDKSYKEIAEIVGITETNVATKINRIKKVLKSKY